MKSIELCFADLKRYTDDLSLKNFLKTLRKCDAFNFCFWFRMSAHENKWVRSIAKRVYRRKCIKYHIHLPVATRIGGGLYIGHIEVGGICINQTTTIGCNVNLSQHTTIGSNKGLAATIGDNVYIGPGVCIVEAVTIGSNVKIGAGAVVIKNVPSNSTAVGVPARNIKH